MLNMATSLGRSGLQDWLIQRVSALILGSYTIFLLGFWLWPANQNYVAWHDLFVSKTMKYITLLVLLAMLAHAWVGLWVITTDYIKHLWLRLSVQLCACVLLLFYTVSGIQLLWPL